jgi:N-acetylmuramoyl-L-alanine amidase
LAIGTGLLTLLWPAQALRSANFVIYLPSGQSVIPLDMVNQVKYLPLVPILNAVGKVEAVQEKRDTFKVWFGDVQIELRLGERRVRVGASSLVLAHPVRKPGGQWMVPVEFLTRALPQLTHDTVEYQVGTNRIFIGNVNPITFSVRLDPTANGARLTVQFSEKVAIRTAASNGKWYLYLGSHPVRPLESSYHFQDAYISDLQFDDQDGVPKLIVTPAAPGLNFYPTLAEGGKILLADVLKPPPAAPAEALGGEAPPIPAAGPAPGPGAPTETTAGEIPPGLAPSPLPIIVLDAAHGGEDFGARGRDGILEKNLVAQLVARTRLRLLATRKYRVLLTRFGDVNPPFEQRERTANMARPAAFLTFHAGNLGITTPRVVVYSYQPSSQEATGPGTEENQLFVPWTQIYRLHQEGGRALAESLQQKLALIPGVTTDKPAVAPVRMLRSIDAPSVAIEVGSLTTDEDSGALTDANFQQQIANAVAAGIEAFRGGAS